MRHSAGENLLLSLYLKEVVKVPLLPDKEGQKRLGRKTRAHQSRKSRDEARNRLVEGSLAFVIRIAKEYEGNGLFLIDLIEEGNLGLLEAAKRYDPQQDTTFLVYATWWIRHAIRRALTHHSRTVVRPPKLVALKFRADREARILRQEKGREPTLKELASRLGKPLHRVQQALEIQPAESLNSFLADRDGENIAPDRLKVLEDRSGTVQLEKLQTRLGIEQVFRILNGLVVEGSIRAIDKKTFVLRRGLDGIERTLQEVGNLVGLTRERIRQIDQKVFQLVRQRMLVSSGNGNGQG